MTEENGRTAIVENAPTPPGDQEDSTNRFERLQQPWSTFVPSKRVLAIGFIAVMVVLAGCGGNSSNGTQTAANGTTDSQPDGTDLASETATTAESGSGSTATTTTGGETTTATNATTTTGVISANTTVTVTPTNGSTGANASNETASNETANTSTATVGATVNSSSGESGLNVVVKPRSANTSDVSLLISAAIGPDSATDGIESITVDAGAGLDVSDVTVANVDTAGIDEGSNQSGSQTDGPSLGSNAEGTIRSADSGNGFVVPLDGNRSIEASDELVVVIDGGVATTEPGNYTFSLGINDASAQEDSYNITEG